MVTAFITGASSSVIDMSLENITGSSDYTFGEIFFTSFASRTISGLTAGLFDKIKIPKLNSGRGSLSSIQKQINTKLLKGTIKNVSLKTIKNIVKLELINLIPSAIIGIFTNELYIIRGDLLL